MNNVTMSERLNDELVHLGAVMVLGTTERAGEQDFLVVKGQSCEVGTMNSIWCFYDHEGKPWVIPCSMLNRTEANRIIQAYNLRFNLSVYVPHSNDCGRFMRKQLPKLRKCQRMRSHFEDLSSGKLETAQQETVKRHLHDCRHCAEAFGELMIEKVGSGELPTLDLPEGFVAPPMELYDRFMTARKEEDPK